MQELRHEYRRWLDRVDIHNLVFLDESGINLQLTRTHGRASIGQRVVDSVPRNYGQNVSLLGALSTDGMIAAMTVSSSVDTPVFQTYGNIGKAYELLGEKQKALDYYNQVLLLLRYGTPVGVAATLANIGSVYSTIGE